MQNLQRYIAKGGTPEKLLSEIVLKNPIMNNLIGMAKSGNINNVENFARNICKAQGRDFDVEFAKFKESFK